MYYYLYTIIDCSLLLLHFGMTFSSKTLSLYILAGGQTMEISLVAVIRYIYILI